MPEVNISSVPDWDDFDESEKAEFVARARKAGVTITGLDPKDLMIYSRFGGYPDLPEMPRPQVDMQKSHIPGAIEYGSSFAGGAIPGAMKGAAAGPLGAVGGGLLGGSLSMGLNMGVNKLFGREPEGSDAANVASLLPVPGGSTLKNAGMRAAETAGAQLVNQATSFPSSQVTGRGKAPATYQNNPIDPTKVGLAGLGSATMSLLMDRLTGARGFGNKMRAVASEKELSEVLKNSADEPGNLDILRLLQEWKGIPKTTGPSVGPKVQGYGNETNLPTAGNQNRQFPPTPYPPPVEQTIPGGRIPVFPDRENVDIGQVSKQVEKILTRDDPRRKLFEIRERTGFDARQLTAKDWKTIDQVYKKNPEAVFSEVVAPIFSAKTSEDLPKAAKELKKNLSSLQSIVGNDKEAIAGVRKAFVSSLFEKEGGDFVTNPDSFVARLKAIGPDTVNTIFSASKLGEKSNAYKVLVDLAEAADKKGGPIQTFLAPKGLYILRAVLPQSLRPSHALDEESNSSGLMKSLASRLLIPPPVGQIAQGGRLIHFSWEKLLEKFAKSNNRASEILRSLADGKQNYSRATIDKFFATLESGADVVKDLP